MADFRTLQTGFLLATRARNDAVADRLGKQAEELLARRPESVAPLDRVRFELNAAERDLYRATPKAAQAALDRLSQLDADPALQRVALSQPAYAVLPAAALGQLFKYAFEGGETAKLDDIARRAEQAIRLGIERGQEAWLRRLADPKQAASSGDDDLVVITRERPEIRALIGAG